MFAMVLLTFAVLMTMFRARVRAVREGKVSATYFRIYQGEVEPESTAKPARHFANLFEAPVLFYAVCLAAMITHFTGAAMQVLAWMAETGVTTERAKQANMGKIYGTTLVLNLLIATSLAMFIGPAADLQNGLFAGFMAGFTYVAAAFGISYLFEFRSFRLWAINAGFQVVVFTVMGAILGIWHK